MRHQVIPYIGCFIIGVLAGAAILYLLLHIPSINGKSVITYCQYPLINPYYCKDKKNIGTDINQAELKSHLETYIEDQKGLGKLTRAAVYYRDLQGGPIMSINGSEPYIGGSLLKVPRMILFLKAAERDETILDRKVHITEEMASSSQVSDPIKAGQSYSILELIERMIIHSDNGARTALSFARSSMPEIQMTLGELFVELGLLSEASQSGEIALIQYAAMFRILYNTLYLSDEMSQLALSILSRTKFDRGLAAGIPQGIVVANKFGIPPNTDDMPQLHDCGIIYHSQGPYLLCIFTEGTLYADLEKIIIEISKKTYQAVDESE